MRRLMALALLLGAGCGWRPSQDAKFESFAESYFEDLLSMKPELATELGDSPL